MSRRFLLLNNPNIFKCDSCWPLFGSMTEFLALTVALLSSQGISCNLFSVACRHLSPHLLMSCKVVITEQIRILGKWQIILPLKVIPHLKINFAKSECHWTLPWTPESNLSFRDFIPVFSPTISRLRVKFAWQGATADQGSSQSDQECKEIWWSDIGNVDLSPRTIILCLGPESYRCHTSEHHCTWDCHGWLRRNEKGVLFDSIAVKFKSLFVRTDYLNG